MEHLELQHDGSYRYQTGTEGEVVDVRVWYMKGRGAYVLVGPVTLKGGMLSMILTHSVGCIVQPYNRSNAKTLAAVAARIDPHVPTLAASAGLIPWNNDTARLSVLRTLNPLRVS